MGEMIYTEGVCDDGAVILRDGIPVAISEVLALLVPPEQAEQRRQDEARAADVAHKGRILRQALEVMVEAMSGAHTGSAAEANEIAKAIITAIAIGKVPAVSIKY